MLLPRPPARSIERRKLNLRFDEKPGEPQFRHPRVVTIGSEKGVVFECDLTGLRKKGLSLAREERTSGELAYRLLQYAPTEQVAA